MKKLNRLLCDKSGNMFPLTIAIALALLFILLGACEYMKLMITMSGIKDAYEEAIISVVNDNYNEVYHCVREGYAAGYEPTGAESFYAVVDRGDVKGRLSGLLGLDSSDGNTLVKRNDAGNVQYRLTNINVNVYNTPMVRSGLEFYSDGSLLAEVPVVFAGRTILYMPVNIKVRAALKEVF